MWISSLNAKNFIIFYKFFYILRLQRRYRTAGHFLLKRCSCFFFFRFFFILLWIVPQSHRFHVTNIRSPSVKFIIGKFAWCSLQNAPNTHTNIPIHATTHSLQFGGTFLCSSQNITIPTSSITDIQNLLIRFVILLGEVSHYFRYITSSDTHAAILGGRVHGTANEFERNIERERE